MELVRDFAGGFNIVGDIEGSGVFPRIPRTEHLVPVDLLADAEQYVDESKRTLKPPKGNDFRVAECDKNIDRLLGDRVRTRKELDARWGRGALEAHPAVPGVPGERQAAGLRRHRSV